MTVTMTIEEQIQVLHDATKKVTKSKASALKFLRDAGIIPHLVMPVKQSLATKKG